ncbi:MAG: PDDEXK nuclease domain-containing protein [Holosporales bacterium]|jgi:predicted nuclease of restriction endonuclease-like (RecB) superfamily|nr:PDDEXK nuclease domain-containing protein [Holosporales bacterium]
MEIQAFENALFEEIKSLIEQSRSNAAKAINAEITALYWHIGRRIKNEVLCGDRAEYGEQVIDLLSKQLTEEYGRGWSKKQLWHCVRMVEVFPDEQIVSALRRQLNWTSIKTLIYIDEPLKRDFYIEMCKMNHWSTRMLQERINSMLFERTAISRQSDNVIAQDLDLLKQEGTISQDLVFRDPYLLDFLGLSDAYSEKDLEAAILTELTRFIIEFGSDFAFMARQKRITVDQEDYYIDLLFFHRRLKCLVAIDLKLGRFQAAFKGQMELYLRWLEKFEMQDGENPPIGLILCSGKSEEHIELMQLDKSNIKVADYLTKLPDMKLLEAKLRQSIGRARNRLENHLE